MKVEKRLVLMLILSATLVTMFLASCTSTARAAPSTQLAIQPIQPTSLTFYANFTTPPATLTFNISVTNVTNLGSWQVTVQWNQSLIAFNSVTLPTDNVFAGQNPVIAGPDTSVPGQVTYGVAAGPSQPGFNGSGVLAQIKLNATTTATPPASCTIGFEGVGTDTFLTALNLADIPFTSVTSTYAYIYAPGTSVTHTISGSSNLVLTASNGTIQANSASISTSAKTLSFNVTGNAGDTAYLFAELPKDVINITTDTWNVTINGVLQPQSAYQITENATYTNIFVPQFAFSSQVAVGIQGDNVIPELSSVLIALLVASTATVAIVKAKTRKKL